MQITNESYIPIWNKNGNKLIEYKITDFNDGYGNSAKLKIAIFKDRKNNLQEIVAQVIWNKNE